MSTAILNVWITNIGDPCTITNTTPVQSPRYPWWVVSIANCNGRVLNWSEGRYRYRYDGHWMPILPHHGPHGTTGWWYNSIPAPDGHVEIEVPPGCYVIRAAVHDWFTNGVLYGNWVTERAIVQASCGSSTCATLYAPSAHACIVPMFEFVIPWLMQHQVISREDGERAIKALKAISNPEAASAFEREEFDTLRQLFQQMGQPIPLMEHKVEEQGEDKR